MAEEEGLGRGCVGRAGWRVGFFHEFLCGACCDWVCVWAWWEKPKGGQETTGAEEMDDAADVMVEGRGGGIHAKLEFVRARVGDLCLRWWEVHHE